MAGWKDTLSDIWEEFPQYRAAFVFTGTVVLTSAGLMATSVIPTMTASSVVTGLGYAAIAGFGYKALKSVFATDEDTKNETIARNFIKEHPELKGKLKDLKKLEEHLKEHQYSLNDIMWMEEKEKVKLNVKSPKILENFANTMIKKYDEAFYHWSFYNEVDKANIKQQYFDYNEQVDMLAKKNNVPVKERISEKDKSNMFDYYRLGIVECAPERVYSISLLNNTTKFLDTANVVQTIDVPKDIIKIEHKENKCYDVRVGNRGYDIYMETPPKDKGNKVSISFKGENAELKYVVKNGIKEERNVRFVFGYCDFIRNLDKVWYKNKNRPKEAKDISIQKTKTQELQRTM